MSKNLTQCLNKNRNNSFFVNCKSKLQDLEKYVKKGISIGVASFVIGLGAMGLGGCDLANIFQKSQPPTPIKENNPPEITSNPITHVYQKSDYHYQVEATDKDGDVLTFSFKDSPDWLQIDSNTGLITGVAPEVNYNETHKVKIKVSDGEDFDTQKYDLEIKNTGISFEGLDPDMNEEQRVEILLPEEDINGKPVVYTGVEEILSSQGESPFKSVDLEGNKLTLVGERDLYGPYELGIGFEDYRGISDTFALNGNILNLIDIAGKIENNGIEGTQTPQEAIIRFFDLQTEEPIKIDKIYTGDEVIGNPLGEYKVRTNSDGEFSIQLDARANGEVGGLESVLVQARAIKPGEEISSNNYISFVRSVELDGEDQVFPSSENPEVNSRVNPAMRVVLYNDILCNEIGEDLNRDGVIDFNDALFFKDFVDEINFFPLLSFHPHRVLTKWDLYGEEDYSLKGIVIWRNQRNGEGFFNDNAIEKIIERIESVPEIIGGNIPSISVLEYEGSTLGNGYINIFPHLGTINGVDGRVNTVTNVDGYIRVSSSQNRVNSNGDVHSLNVLFHEYALQTFAMDEPVNTLDRYQSILPHIVYLDSTSKWDIKAAEIIYESTYPVGERFDYIFGTDWVDSEYGFDWTLIDVKTDMEKYHSGIDYESFFNEIDYEYASFL